MVITDDGRIGIGTNNPSSQLDIVAGGTDASQIELHQTNIDGKLIIRADRFGNAYIANKNDFLGNGSTGNAQLRLLGQNGIRFQYGDAGIDGTVGMVLMDNGNVAIGGTTTDARLGVATGALGTTAGDSVINSSFITATGNSSKLTTTTRRFSNGTDWGSTNVRLERVVDVTSQGFIDFGIDGRAANYGLGFGSEGNTHMVIERNGNVGIGTNDPGNF